MEEIKEYIQWGAAVKRAESYNTADAAKAAIASWADEEWLKDFSGRKNSKAIQFTDSHYRRVADKEWLNDFSDKKNSKTVQFADSYYQQAADEEWLKDFLERKHSEELQEINIDTAMATAL